MSKEELESVFLDMAERREYANIERMFGKQAVAVAKQWAGGGGQDSGEVFEHEESSPPRRNSFSTETTTVRSVTAPATASTSFWPSPPPKEHSDDDAELAAFIELGVEAPTTAPPLALPPPPPPLPVLPKEKNPPDQFASLPACFFLHDVLRL